MNFLANGCSYSTLSVHPKNWQTVSASTKINWYIHFRFYDPRYRDQYPTGKLRQVKGMNSYKDLKQRREYTKGLIKQEIEMLTIQGFNPILGTFEGIALQGDVSSYTPFIAALKVAEKKIKAVQGTLTDIKSVIKGTEAAAIKIGIADLPVSQVTRKYIKRCLEQCQQDNPRFSNHRWNKYRAYLMRLFKELVEMEAVDINPVRDISELKVIPKKKEILTRDERTRIDKQLKEKSYPFWRFVQIFYHSGARETELMKIRKEDVDLVSGTVRYIIKKGNIGEADRVIKDVVKHLWEEIISECKAGDYLFSKGLVPGSRAIRPDQPARRWAKWVMHPKTGLNIQKTLYRCKHTNTDETAALLGIKDAASHNSHTNTKTAMIYAVNEIERQNDRLRKVANDFA